MWVKIKPPGIGPQVLVHVSIYRVPFWVYPVLDPQPFGSGSKGEGPERRHVADTWVARRLFFGTPTFGTAEEGGWGFQRETWG